MSFNLDDPLAGILSEGSDDSFFDDDILGKKKSAKKKSPPTVQRKNTLFDLGESEVPPVIESKKENLPETKKTYFLDDFKIDKPESHSPFKRSTSKESIKLQQTSFRTNVVSDKLDLSKSPSKLKIGTSAEKLNELLGDSDYETKKNVKTVEKSVIIGKSSQFMLDDILGGPSTKAVSKNPRPATAKSDLDFDTILSKDESKKSLVLSKNVLNKQQIETKPKLKADEPKKEIHKKSAENWLGIFQDDEPKNDEEADTGMPAWLGGGQKTQKEPSKEKQQTVKTKDIQIDKDNEQKENVKSFENNTNNEFPKLVDNMSILSTNNEDIAATGAALCMQQQESQLMVALQLKAQEEKLAAMQIRQKDSQRVQHEVTLTQQTQLDAMLQRQAAQRQQMQAIIASHQERITERIKDLLGTTDLSPDEHDSANVDYDSSGPEKKLSPHMKEKKQLLQLVQSLQENHDKEIDLMETSYRRQLAFLEISLTQSEERMKDDNDKLVKFYAEKIHWMEEHHQLFKKLTEENLSSVTDQHKSENEMLRQQHLENVRVLQEHHSALMENVKNAVKHEQAIVKDSAGFSSDLQELVSDVKENKHHCQLLVERVDKIVESTQKESERSLHARESQITEIVQQLKRERENFETEKVENREIVKMLETRLKQMTSMIEEETINLKQKRMEFEFDKATFNKQTEFAKNVLKRQDDEMKILKEDLQKEYKDKITIIEEEKLKAVKDSASAAKDKMAIQNIKQELEKMKAQLHAQLEEVTEERSKMNLEKQEIHMEEQRVLAKSRDLDLLAKTAIEKQSQADKKYSEAEFIQKKYEERIRRIQEQVASITTREKQIAKEKVALSRERLSLHDERKQMETRFQCSLCKSQNVSQLYGANYNELADSYLNMPVSRDYGGTNVDSTVQTIENEMAHLLGRNFSLRHSINSANYADKVIEDKNDIAIAQSSQDSGTYKDFMDPKLMMLRLDVQKVIENLDQNKKDDSYEHEEKSQN